MLETKAVLVIISGILLVLVGLYSERSKGVVLIISRTVDKKVNIIYFGIFVLFWLFAVSVTDSYDISNYRYAYVGRIAHSKEPLFDLIQFSFHDAGWSFDAFKLIWVTLVSILLYLAIKRYSDAPGAVAALALIAPLTAFVTQMRSALVGAIVLNAFSLILTGKRKDRVIYFIIVVLGAQIHIISYAFLIFLLINPRENRTFRTIYYVIIAAITLVAFFFSNFYIQAIYDLISFLPLTGNNVIRTLSYFQGEGNHFRYAFFLICKHLLLFFLANEACEIQIKGESYESTAAQKYRMIREANMLLLLFLPITIISESFERIFNCFALLQYAVVFNSGKSKVLLLKRISWQQSLQSLMVIGIFFITGIELYFSPDDMIKILNSVKWPF